MTTAPIYLCHDCGNILRPRPGAKMLWCWFCEKQRRVPTDWHLILPQRAPDQTEAT